jgi:para-aminobenzoate synthetase component I
MIFVRPAPTSGHDFAWHRAQLASGAGAPDSWAGGWTYRPQAPLLRLWCDADGREATLAGPTGTVRRWSDPLAALAWMPSLLRERPAAHGPPFKGGWIGWLSYDLGRLFEPRVRTGPATDDLRLPLFDFTYHGSTLAYGPERVLVANAHDLGDATLPAPREPRQGHSPLASTLTRDRYLAAAGRAIEYIAAGDAFQVNLSQRFTTGLRRSPRDVFEHLCHHSPAGFGAFLTGDDYALVSNSPELFLRVTPDSLKGKRTVITRPIKGTRPRGPGMEAVLRDSAKDQAELNMIVDLERNDLGRVCEIGAVRVTEPRSIEAHPTVYHGVATVEGVLRDDVTFLDLLRATFPGGSVTGAPKIRAMQIIDELEPTRRGPYCGAIGYLSADGHIELNVAIRTMILKDGLAHVPVGGGIVADSDPAAEYEETLVKARAMFAALGVSVDELRGQART